MNSKKLISILLLGIVSISMVSNSLTATPWHKRIKAKRRAAGTNKRLTLSTMNYEQLKIKKNECLAKGDTRIAIKYLDQMRKVCTDLQELIYIMVELADLLFDLGELDKAGVMYHEFTKLYPGNEKMEYALYRAVLCSFYKILGPEHDQTKTKETIELADAFLKRSDVFTTYHKEVKEIAQQCTLHLCESELQVFDFYLNRGRIKPAEHRLTLISDTYLELVPEIEPTILTCEIRLAEKQDNTTLAETKRNQLIAKYPETSSILLTQNRHAKRRLANRF